MKRLAAAALVWMVPAGGAAQEGAPLAPAEPVPIVRSVEVSGLEPLPVPVRPEALPLRPGVVYSEQRLLETERLLLRRFAEAGYPFAVTTVGGDLSIDEGFADVRVEVRSGPRAVFGAANIDDASPLTDAEVRARLLFRPGDPFSVEALEHSAERIARIPVVEQVTLHVLPAPARDSLLVATFVLGTGRVQGLGAEGSISSARCVEGLVGWWNRHLFGAPRTLTLNVGGSNLLAGPLRRFPCTGTGEAEFADPDYAVRGELREPIAPATWFFVSGELSRLSAPQAYIRRGVQARIGFAHELARGLEGMLAVAPQRQSNPAGAPLYCGVYGVCDGVGLSEMLGPRSHVPVEATLTWTPPRLEGIVGATPASPLWLQPVPRPWRILLRTSLLAAAGGDFTYGSGTVEGSAARLLTSRFEIAARTRAGFVGTGRDPLPLQVRLFGGGLAGVRGVQPNRLGPKILTASREEVEAIGCQPVPGGCEGITADPDRVIVRPAGGTLLGELTLEARFWVARWLQMGAFADYGAVRSGGPAEAPVGIAPSEAVLTPGVGVLVLSPLGPVRIDLGYDPSPPRRYPLLTPTEDGEGRIWLGGVRYDPFTFDHQSAFREFRRRIRFHLSMGQLF